jgi:type I restriction enzyme S subunit
MGGIKMDKWNLPPGWDWIPIDKLCDLYGGSTPKRSRPEYFDGEIVWVTPSDLDNAGPIQTITDSTTKITRAGLDSCSARLLSIGTVLFSSRATVGKVAIAGVELATNQGFANFVCGPRIYNHYLAWCLRALTESIKKLASSTTYLEVSKKALRPFTIPMPYPREPERSLAEQRRIVARIEALLIRVAEMRELHARIIRDTGKLMDAVLSEVFSQPAREVWPNDAPLGEVAEITASQVDPTLPEYRNLPHIYGKTVKEGTGRLLTYNTAAEDGMTSGKYHFQRGAVLYSKIRPYLRKVTICNFMGLCSADIYPLRLKTEEITKEFLMWTLLSLHFTDYANRLSGRARIPKINRTQLFGYQMRYPDLSEQERITIYLFQIQTKMTNMQEINSRDATHLDQLEQAILAQAFRGEL